MSKKKPRSGTSRQQQQAAAQARRRGADARGAARPAPATSIAVGPAAVETVGSSDPEQDLGAPPESPEEGDPGRGGSEWFYVDVAAVRIQEWLGRTPSLKFRRGASVLLTEETGREQWEGSLPDGVVWNEEAGDLPGVVSLRVPSGANPATAEATVGQTAQVIAEQTARRIVSRLRSRIPHCAFQAVGAPGATYADAYAGIARARRRGDFLVDSPAPAAEVVLAKPCDLCLQAAAVTGPIRVVDRDRFVCAECAARFDAAGGTKGSWEKRSPAPERRMRDVIRSVRPQVEGFSEDFADMAAAGGLAQDDAPTQLALIYADGNKVGAFLTRVARWAELHGKPDKREIVVAIDQATVTALATAVVATFVDADLTGIVDDSERATRYGVRPPVLAHVAGGDDLMVSVPAAFGWPLARHLLAGFDKEIGHAAAGWGLAADEGLPSLSAGLVFHHHTHPFSDVVALATAQLKAAKRAFRGEEAAVSFVDLTADGDRMPQGRRPVSARWLDGAQDLLARLAVVAASQRTTLTALHRQAGEPGATDGERAAAVEALARRAVDLGSPAVWEAAAGPHATGDQVRTHLLQDAQARDGLRECLDLARWWPPETWPRTAPSAAQEAS